MTNWSLADVTFLPRMWLGKVPAFHQLIERFCPSLNHRLIIPSSLLIRLPQETVFPMVVRSRNLSVSASLHVLLVSASLRS